MKDFKTTAKENEILIRKLYESFQKGDLKGILPCLSTDCILTVPGTDLNSGEYWGHKGFEKNDIPRANNSSYLYNTKSPLNNE